MLAEGLGLPASNSVHDCPGRKFLGSFTHGLAAQELRTWTLKSVGSEFRSSSGIYELGNFGWLTQSNLLSSLSLSLKYISLTGLYQY